MKTPNNVVLDRRSILLGPVPCQECGRLIVWDGLFWLFRGTNIIHVRKTCPATFSGSGG